MIDIRNRTLVTFAARQWPWQWIVVPVSGALWATRQLRHSYFFYDEWSMIGRVLHMPAGAGTMASFNGHLWMLQYWLYRAQVSWFGVNDHAFICVVFVCSLVALHLSLAALLRGAGLSTASSLLTGGLLTYLGVASQTFIFAIETSPAWSLAAGVAAAATALARPPSASRCVVAGTLMLISVGLDSGIAIGAISLACGVVVLAWRRVGAFVSVPSMLALGWWLVAGDLGPDFPATVRERAAFAGHLLLRALGGLIGQGEIAGALVLLLSVTVIVHGLRERYVTGPGRTLLIAGTIATGLVTAELAQSRAGLAGFNFVDFNRYLQGVAVPSTLALVSGLATITRAWLGRRPHLEQSRIVACIAPMLIVVAFILGVGPMRAYSGTFQSWNVATRLGVRSATVVIRDGCPSGVAPVPSSRPLGDLDPQISTQLLRELIQRGALAVASSVQPDPAVVNRMCSQAGSTG